MLKQIFVFSVFLILNSSCGKTIKDMEQKAKSNDIEMEYDIKLNWSESSPSLIHAQNDVSFKIFDNKKNAFIDPMQITKIKIEFRSPGYTGKSCCSLKKFIPSLQSDDSYLVRGVDFESKKIGDWVYKVYWQIGQTNYTYTSTFTI